jgi:hypothetical protein
MKATWETQWDPISKRNQIISNCKIVACTEQLAILLKNANVMEEKDQGTVSDEKKS